MFLDVIHSADEALVGRRIPLDPATPRITLGRDPSSTIAIQSVRMSRHHARIEWDGACWRVFDDASTSGTFVNGMRIQSHELRPGDTIQIGCTHLRVGK